MIKVDSFPESREAAQHLAVLHLGRARGFSDGYAVRKALRRIVDALIGVGYAVLALSMDHPANQEEVP